MFRLTARVGIGLSVLAASAATLSLAQPPISGSAPPAQPGSAPTASAAILDFTSIQNQWHWLRKEGDEVRLLTSAPGAAAETLLSGRGWTEVAVDEESIWLLQRDGSRGSLVKLPRGGGTPTVVFSSLQAPGGLTTLHRRVFWIESRPAAVPGLLYVPAAEARNVVRMLAEDGTVSDLGEMVGGSPAGNDDLQGMASLLYARLRRAGSTEFYLTDLRDFRLKRVAVESGLQQGFVFHKGFVWTAPSEEASDPDFQRCLRRSMGEGSTASITDWLPPNGRLLRLGPELHYAGLELYRIPETSGEAAFVSDLPPGEITTDGDRIVLLDPQTGPKVVPLNASQH